MNSGLFRYDFNNLHIHARISLDNLIVTSIIMLRLHRILSFSHQWITLSPHGNHGVAVGCYYHVYSVDMDLLNFHTSNSIMLQTSVPEQDSSFSNCILKVAWNNEM